jgi:hypothetical protein
MSVYLTKFKLIYKNTIAKKYILAIINLFIFFPCTNYPQQTINGYVFIDKNNNGIKNANEPGINGVSVSDQVSVLKTNADGACQINSVRGYGFVMIGVPGGHKSDLFWERIAENKNTSIDFALTIVLKLHHTFFPEASCPLPASLKEY